MRTVAVQKVKRPSGGSRWSAYVVREGRDGAWLFCPAGSIGQLCGGETWIVPTSGLQFLPTSSWWVAWWWLEPAGAWRSVDVCTPATFTSGGWSYDDLELDCFGGESSFGSIVDQEEFDIACERGWISREEASAAVSAAQDVKARMQAGSEPFAPPAWELARQLDLRGLAPLEQPP